MTETIDINKMLVIWKRKDVINALQINKLLTEHGKDWKAVEDFLALPLTELIKRNPTGIICRECGKIMSRYLVNHLPCAQVGEDYKSQWYCECGYSIYNKD